MFGLGMQEILLLAILGVGGIVVVAVVLVASNSSGRGRERPPEAD